MKAVLLVNPRASRVDEARIAAVEAVLRPLATLRTERPGHATELVTALADEVDALVVFSGDGGYNEALNGLQRDLPVGFLPGGATSVLPRALGLPRDPVAAARRLAAARTRRISLGRVNGRRFAFSAGLGVDAEVVRRVDAIGRRHDGRRPGDAAYVRELLRVLAARRGRLEPVLEVRGLGRGALALVLNSDVYTYAGPWAVRAGRGGSFESGLELVAPERVDPARVLRLLAYLGGARAPRWLLRGRDLRRLEVACDAPLPLQADGEDLGDVREAAFECEPSAVAVLV